MGKRMWDIKESTSHPNELDLYIYNDVEGDYYDWWTGEVIESETSAQHFRAELERHANVKQINIYINSYGGSVYEGTAIYNQLKRHSAHKTVYVDGFACSIASVIAMAGDEIIMPENALMMIHNMWMSAVGNSAELRKAADDLDIINTAGRAAYLKKANGKLSEEELIKLMDAETWLTAEQCLRLGLADKYGEEEADMSGVIRVLQKANSNLQQHIELRKGLVSQLKMFDKGEALGIGKKKEEKEEEKSEKIGSIMEMLTRFFID